MNPIVAQKTTNIAPSLGTNVSVISCTEVRAWMRSRRAAAFSYSRASLASLIWADRVRWIFCDRGNSEFFSGQTWREPWACVSAIR